MAGFPTLTVELDDGTGTWPYNISQYVDVRPSQGYTITHGRQDEFGITEASTLVLNLKNNDGRFTLGRAAPVYPLKVGMPIRISAQPPGGFFNIRRFTGWVTSWPVEWPGGKKQSRATITASNVLARLARRPLVGSLIRNEVVAADPGVYYPMSEPASVVYASDASGNGVSPLVQVSSGTAVQFGSTDAPGSEADTAAALSGGKFLAFVGSGSALPAPGDLFGVVIAFSTTSPTAMYLVSSTLALPGNGFRLYLDVGGVLKLNGTAIPGVWNDGLGHVVGVRLTGTNAADVYVDGVLRASGISSGPFELPDLLVGGQAGFNLIGRMAHLAIWDTAPTAAQMVTITGALVGFPGERSDERIARLAAYAGIDPASLALDVGQQLLGPQAPVDGVGVLDAMRDVEAAEQGLLFADTSGSLVFQSRANRYNHVVDVSISAKSIDPSARFAVDDQGLYNRATVTRPDGAPQTYENAASIADLGVYPYDAAPALQTDDQALQVAAWVVNTYGVPGPRMSSAQADLLTAVLATANNALFLGISSCIQITALPTQAPAAAVSLFIEGWTETCHLGEWSVNFNTSPASDFQVFQLDVTPLDSVYRLAL